MTQLGKKEDTVREDRNGSIPAEFSTFPAVIACLRIKDRHRNGDVGSGDR
jgi:hypothetical protein